MDTELRNIAGLLTSVQHGLDISGISQRKLLQKVVYIAQRLGLPMNYDFNWYIHGPYSPQLTKDYYRLQSEVANGQNVASYRLVDDYAGVANNLTSLLRQRPADVSEADWAELLASVLFLKNESGQNLAEIRQTINQRKPHVAPYVDHAVRALHQYERI